jgi:hypothetical protein
MELFSIFGKVGLEGVEAVQKQLTKTVENAEHVGKTMRKIGVGMSAVGGALTGVAFKTVDTWAKAGDEVEKMSRRLGFSTTALSELKHAAELSGSSLGDIERNTRRLQRAIVDGQDGLTTYTRAFGKLGLDVDELAEKNPEEQFIMVTEALADLDSQSLKAAVAQQIFGRAGTKMLPMLDQGSEGLQEMREEAHELGIVFDRETAEKSAKFTDDMLRLKRSFQGIFFTIAEDLFPVLDEWIIKGKEIGIQVSQWISENEDLVAGLAIFTTTVGGLLAVVGPLLIVFGQLIIVAPAVATGFMKIQGAISPATVAILLAVGAIAQLVMKFREAKKALDEAHGSMDQMKQDQQEMNDMMIQGVDIWKQYGEGTAESVMKAGISMEEAKEGMQGMFAMASQLDGEERQRWIARAELYKQVYEELRAKHEEVTESNLNSSSDAMSAEEQALKEQLEEMKKMMEEMKAKHEEVTESKKEQLKKMKKMMEEFQDDSVDSDEETTEKLINHANRWGSVYAGNINQMLKGSKNFSEGVQGIFEDLGNAVIQEISRMIAKWTAFLALKGIANILTGGAFGAVGSFLGMAEGGVITEPIIGTGMRSGTTYALGENAPGEVEHVIPEGKMGKGGDQYNITLKTDIHADKIEPESTEEVAQRMTDALRSGDYELINFAKEVVRQNDKYGDEV